MSDLVPVGWNLNLKSELPHDVSQKVSTSGEASVSNRVWRHSTELSVPCTPVRTLSGMTTMGTLLEVIFH